MPKVSVCIPSYNHEKFLPELLESILSQNFQDFEIIICDDVSTDNSVEIIKSFRDPRIRLYLNSENLGIVNNMNKCLSLAQGDLINVMGSDDAMLPENLFRKVEFLKKNSEAAFVCSNIIKVDENGQFLGNIWSPPPKQDCIIDKKSCFRRLILEGNFICHSTVMIRKECHNRLGVYDDRFPAVQDYEMWTRLSLNYNLGYISDPLVKYRWHPGNETLKHIKGKNTDKAIEQSTLSKRVSMENYRNHSSSIFFTKSELSQIYFEMGRFYFWNNNFPLSRRLLRTSMSYNWFRIDTFYYLLLASLSLSLLNPLRKIKGTNKNI